MKQFLATLAGLLSGVFVIFVIEYIGHQLTDFKIQATTLEEFREAMLNVPPSVLIPVAIAHTGGTLVGLIVSRLIEKEYLSPMIYVAGVLTLFTFINLLSFPHPVWFWAMDLGLVILVSLSYILTRKKS